MANLFATGRIVDCIVALMVIECTVLLVFRKRLHLGSPTAVAATFGAGAALLCALRAALTGSAWQFVAGWLVLALIAHVIDVKVRCSRVEISSKE